QEGGPAALGVFFEPGKEHDMFWLIKDRQTRRGPFSFTLNGFDVIYYTGIQVSSDPGIPLVWIGFMLLISGLVLSLMVSHTRVWMRIRKIKDGHEVLIAADVSKNRGSFKERFDQSFLRFQKGEDT
ncbi:MAG TPA: cytochrome c biogenesis protein ResB, partial [Deltaproteobacteria bacterium]|nr:cytochrome c biogenesis protein ResB [Deltaproteobacteria bacterium]